MEKMPRPKSLTDSSTGLPIEYSVIGLNKEDAINLIKFVGGIPRITSEDGRAKIVTKDIRLDRVNLEVAGGKVLRARIG